MVAPEISRQLLLEKRVAVYDSLIAALVARAKIDVLDPGLQYAIEVSDSIKALRPGAAATPLAGFVRAVPEPEDERRTVARPDTTGNGELEGDLDE